MNLDERLRLPCGICGQRRSTHMGSVHGCPGGYGTYWNPEGERDHRVWPLSTEEQALKQIDAAIQSQTKEGTCE